MNDELIFFIFYNYFLYYMNLNLSKLNDNEFLINIFDLEF